MKSLFDATKKGFILDFFEEVKRLLDFFFFNVFMETAKVELYVG